MSCFFPNLNNGELRSRRQQVENSGRRFTKKAVHDVFNRYAQGEGNARGIGISKFKDALCEVRPEFGHMVAEDQEKLFKDSDLGNDNVLNESEFWYALCQVFPVEQALSVLPLHRVLESALPGFCTENSKSHLETFVNLSDQEIALMVAAAAPEIERLLCDLVHSLKKATELQTHKLAVGKGAKFSVTASGGKIEEFHAGLSGRVGGK